MENILTKYLQHTAHAEAFTVLEQELAKLIIATVEHGDYIAIKKSLLERLAKVEPALLTLNKVFTFKSKLSDMLTRSHPISKLIPIQERNLIKLGTNHNEGYENIYGDETLPIYSFQLSNIADLTSYLTLDPNDPKNYQFIDYVEYELFRGFFSEFSTFSSMPFTTLNSCFDVKMGLYIHKNHLYFKHDELIKEYYKLIKRAKKNQDTRALALTYLKEKYLRRITSALYPILRDIRENKIEHLLGIFLDIANMNGKQLVQFTSDYYTDLPYFPKNRKPITAILERTEDLIDGVKTRLLIRSDKQLVNIVFSEFGCDKVLKYDLYEIGRGEQLTLSEFKIDIDENCLAGDYLTTLEMILYGSSEVKIYKDFKYVKHAIWDLAMSGSNENAFTLYLQDRSGLHHRWK